MSNTTALIIDDEPDIRELISLTITRMGIDCHVAANLEEARNLLGSYDFDICLTDMKLPDGNGVEFVRFLQANHPSLPVAVITAHGNMEAAVEAMKNGAYDFVSKPVDIHSLRKLITTAVASRVKAANDSNRSTSVDADDLPNGTDELIGDSLPMQQLRKMIIKLAQSNAPVWITGESGTGKEMIAKLIHQNSARSSAPFIPINCGAIPSELMESELFGHKKGSFTGAVTDNDGLFRRAEGGTLFLDEVAELPLHMQVKLLRAIQEKSVRPVGGTNEIPIDVRILSASHKDLVQEVESGRFRHDLYYRLNVIKLRAPSLSERAEDIPLLSKHLITRLCNTNGLSECTLSESALSLLTKHTFNGNVRELENTLERALALTDGSIIDEDDLELSSLDSVSPNTSIEPTPQPLSELIKPTPEREQRLIREALHKTHWNRKAAADLLGLSYRQLRYRIQQYRIDDSTEE